MTKKEELTADEIETESRLIMKRVYEYEANRKKVIAYKPLIAIAAVLMLMLLPYLNKNESSYGLKQISANEYKLDIFGDAIYFNVFALVENPNRVVINERIGTYEGFQKYFDVSHEIKVKLLNINDFLFLEISQNGEIIEYFYVNNIDEHNRSVSQIDREFDNFEASMAEITTLVKQYPFDYEINNDICYQAVSNQKSEQLSEQEQSDYEWFKTLTEGVCSSDPITEYEVVMYFDGTVDNIGNYVDLMHREGGRYDVCESDFPVYFSPEDNYFGSSFWAEDSRLTAHSYMFFNGSDPFGEFAVGARLDLQNYQLENLDIKMIVNGNELTDFIILQDEQFVYVMPQFVNAKPTYYTEQLEGETKQREMISRTVNLRLEITDKTTLEEVYVTSNVYSSSSELE